MILSWFALTLSFFIAAKFLKGFKIEGGVGSHIGVAALYGVMLILFNNFVVKFLLGFLTFGATWIPYLGSLLIGTVLLVLTDKISKRLSIDGIGTVFATVLITMVTRFAVDQVFAFLG